MGKNYLARDYQQAAIDGVWQYFLNGNTGNPVVAMPTGTGKSLVIAKLIESMVKQYPSTRILILTHVKELIENNYKTFMDVWPAAPAGIYSAGLKRKDIGAQITFAGIQSIRGRAKAFSNTHLIIIDEAHLVSDSDNTTYRRFIAEVKELQPHLKIIGLTATAFRLGLGMLTDGGLFDDICFDLTSGEAFLWLIDNGYLSPLVTKKPGIEINTSGLHMRGGEFIPSEVDEAIAEQNITDGALAEIVDRGENRNSWLIFASSIAHCDEIEEKLQGLGIPAAAVHSKLTGTERDQRVAAFKEGQLRAVVNKDILTTGFDHPGIDLIAMLRPTQSPGLWVQMLGRGTRPVFAHGFDISTSDGRLAAIATGPKQNCLVLDFAGNTRRLGPINYPTIPKRRGGGGGEPPVRECPKCGTYNHISKPACEECGYVFPREEKTTRFADQTEVVARKAPEPMVAVIYPVHDMMAWRHEKLGRPDSLRVTYRSGNRRFNVFVCPEHPGGARHMAQRWWAGHAPEKGQKMPATVADMLEAWEHIRRPRYIKVTKAGKYPEVREYDFTDAAFPYDTASERVGDADTAADKERAALSVVSDLHEFR